MLVPNGRDDDLSGSPFTLSEMGSHVIVDGIFWGNYVPVPQEEAEYHTEDSDTIDRHLGS